MRSIALLVTLTVDVRGSLAMIAATTTAMSLVVRELLDVLGIKPLVPCMVTKQLVME